MVRVLVVDDNPDIVYSIKKGIDSLQKNYEINGVSGGQECISYLNRNRPDLIILDLMMPGVNGWQVIEKLHATKDWKSIPVIVITAKYDVTDAEIRSLGVQDFVRKPFEIKDLEERMRKVLLVQI